MNLVFFVITNSVFLVFFFGWIYYRFILKEKITSAPIATIFTGTLLTNLRIIGIKIDDILYFSVPICIMLITHLIEYFIEKQSKKLNKID